MKERPTENEPGPLDFMEEAKALYALFPVAIRFVEAPDMIYIQKQRDEWRRRSKSEMKVVVLNRYSTLLDNARITPNFRGLILNALSNQWNNGVVRPGEKEEKIYDLSLEELQKRRFPVTAENYEDFIRKAREIDERNSHIPEPAPLFDAPRMIGFDDPDGEGIFHPEKAKERERAEYVKAQKSQKSLQESLGELQFQQLNAFIGKKFDTSPQNEDWHDAFVRVHGEEPI